MAAEVIRIVSETVEAINNAKRVDDVVVALHSVALLLFPLDIAAISCVISEPYRDQLLNAEVASAEERQQRWKVFYQGAGFPTLARILLHDVASNWLPCFPLSASKLVYDIFFTNGLSTEVVQTLVPCLGYNGGNGYDAKSVRANAERLIELCLIENQGVLKIARHFGDSFEPADSKNALNKSDHSQMAQLIASIPDKASLGAPKSLSSLLFFMEITIQLLAAAEERKLEAEGTCMDGTIQFVGDMFARICRRGSADLLLSQVTPKILRSVRNFLSNKQTVSKDDIKVEPSFHFWFLLMEAVRDPYAVEKIAEQSLHQLASEHASDIDAYWVIWILFHQITEHQSSVRFLFIEKFLLWKVFPLCCLRWILQFAVLECPPYAGMLTKGEQSSSLLDTVQRLVVVWSKQEFLQTAPVEQQTYVTAALGLLLDKMSREELDSSKYIMRSILEGVSFRLENPSDLIRRMASSVGFVFSMIIDPKNPLCLDDSCSNGDIDWEFGTGSSKNGTIATMDATTKEENRESASLTAKKLLSAVDDDTARKLNSKGRIQHRMVDPDEIVDPASLNDELVSDEDRAADESDVSESSSDSSLQPYDLTDDDTDLKRKFSQLVDVVGALRKSDDADGVERALDVAETLVRASPDELCHVAGDLVRTLVQVRCSDFSVEGEEETAEEKRQKALVALLVTSPFESLDTLNKMLYSPHLDVSQRMMILDVMTDAAQELSNAKNVKQRLQARPLISSIGEIQPWFLPSSEGPPGASSWKEVANDESPLNWSYRYERTLPLKSGQIKKGRTRRWSLREENNINDTDWSLNKFPLYAAAFMLPAMQGYDKKRHGVDLLGRDFIVLGKLIYMLGVCMKCIALHPEASALAPALLDMLSSRQVCRHKEAYVRKSVLFAASCTLMALHPSSVASALSEGNQEVCRGLEWVRTWALEVTESDTDRECYTMAMACLQIHAEMSLKASRALQSSMESTSRRSVELPTDLLKGIVKIPSSKSPLLY